MSENSIEPEQGVLTESVIVDSGIIGVGEGVHPITNDELADVLIEAFDNKNGECKPTTFRGGIASPLDKDTKNFVNYKQSGTGAASDAKQKGGEASCPKDESASRRKFSGKATEAHELQPWVAHRDKTIDSLRTVFAYNLKTSRCSYGIPEEHVGSFAAVLTVVDYINQTMPFVLHNKSMEELADSLGTIPKDKKHPMKDLDCSSVLKGCMREIEAENLEDLDSYEVVSGGVIDSVEYYYFWVNGHKRSASSMPRYIFTELQNVYKGVLGRDMPLHSAEDKEDEDEGIKESSVEDAKPQVTSSSYSVHEPYKGYVPPLYDDNDADDWDLSVPPKDQIFSKD